MIFSTQAPARTAEPGDVELMSALLKLERPYRTPVDMNAENSRYYGLGAFLTGIVGVLGGTSAYLIQRKTPEQLQTILGSDLQTIRNFQRRAKPIIRKHGSKVAKGLLITMVASWVVSEIYDHMGDVEAKQLRLIGSAHPQTYANRMAEFVELPLAERFLIAKSDPRFAAHLIDLAHTPGRKHWYSREMAPVAPDAEPARN